MHHKKKKSIRNLLAHWLFCTIVLFFLHLHRKEFGYPDTHSSYCGGRLEENKRAKKEFFSQIRHRFRWRAEKDYLPIVQGQLRTQDCRNGILADSQINRPFSRESGSSGKVSGSTGKVFLWEMLNSPLPFLCKLTYMNSNRISAQHTEDDLNSFPGPVFTYKGYYNDNIQ